ITDAKEMWEAIKSRFDGNDESKKMQKYILKQQFEGFSVSNSEGLHKGYDRFQSLLSQLEIHGAGVDSLSFDDLYNNLRVFESDVKGSIASSSNTQNVPFVLENTSSTNDVSTTYGVSNSTEQLDEFDLEEMDLKWQVAMISIRMKKFYKKTGTKLQFEAKEPVGFDKTKEDSKALVTIDREGVDWTSHSEEKEDYALMACNSSSSKTEAQSCSNECVTSYNKLKKLYDEQRAQLSDASIEIQAYTQGLKKVEAQLVAHQQGQLWDHRYDGILSYENEVLQSVFMSKKSDFENQPLYDRFVTTEGMHATQPSESDTQTSVVDTCESNISEETPELVFELVVNELNVVCQPKVWSDAPIIEEYESDSDDYCVSKPTKQETPSFANQQVKTPRETVKNHFTHSKNPKVDKKELGNSSQREIRPIWNNVQRVNNQNQFVPTAVLTRTGKIPVNTARASGTKNVSTARHSFNRQAVLTSAAMKVNTVKPIVNRLVLLGEKGKLLLSPQQVVIGDHKDTTGTMSPNTMDYPHRALQNKGIVDSGCSRHMTGNKTYLAEYQDFNGGPVAFRGSKGYITGKGKIKTGKLDFEDVCFVKELQHFNLFSVSQMCDKKNKVLFTDSECLVLSPEFKLPDANQVLLRIPRQNNMYSFNLENIVPSGGLACLIAKATINKSNKWHRRLGHVKFKNLNKLVKGNLVRGLPSKIFQNDHTCVACQKGKQHKASCKAKTVSSISHSLQLLHMDLFGPTSVKSLNDKTYCMVITDDSSRFSWVFFLRTKDETSGIIKDFIRQIENQLNQKVKTIRCDNGYRFKNKDVIEFRGPKEIKREYSNARTPQQNRVAKRKNRTLIEAARTMLADLVLPNTFWAEAVSTACYVLNRVLVTKPHNKTPYELITDKIPIISYIRPFRCHVTILNTIDHLGKFDGKLDEGFLVGSDNRANKHAGLPEANQNAGTEDIIDAGDSEKEDESAQDYFVLPIWSSYSSTIKRSRAEDAGAAPHKHPDLKTDEKPVDKEDQVFLDELERLKRQEKDANDAAEALRKEFAQETENLLIQVGAAKASSTNIVNTVSTPVSTASLYDGLSLSDPTNPEQDDSEIPVLEDIYQNPTDGIFTNSSYDDEGAVADFTNLESVVNVSPIPTSRIHSIHPSTLILRDPKSAVQTRSKVTKSSGAYAFVDAMQEELLQFKIQKVWILVDLPYGKKAIGTKWVYRNKKDERGVVVRNKARLVYQMDVKSAFLYGKIDEEVYVSQPPGFLDPKYPQKVYKVVKTLYGLHQAPRAWYATLSTFLLNNGYRRGTIDKTLFLKKGKHNIILVQVYVDDIIFGSTKKSWCDEFEALMKSRFQMSSMGELTFFLGLQVKQKADGIFISQDKYKPLVKDEEASDVDVHLYRSMIGSLMYLTASRPDIMFVVCACSRFQVSSKGEPSHLSAVRGLGILECSSIDMEVN
ncbi:putative ribonuclease H-like domain-containing protein, partial [Tanacetum coccineum]